MIKIHIKAGLGNQMFQYVLGLNFDDVSYIVTKKPLIAAEIF